MTRLEEIKSKMESCEDVRWVFSPTDPTIEYPFVSAKSDINHLLARNEELQRENEKMKRVIKIIKDNPFTFSSWLDKGLAIELGAAMPELDADKCPTCGKIGDPACKTVGCPD